MSEKRSVVLDSDDVKPEKVDRGEKIWIQRLITDSEGANNCFMRMFTLKPGASMPLHRHEDTDHVQYILDGKMKVKLGNKTKVVEEGDVLYISSGLLHSYENPYEEKMKFICIVPAGEIHTEIKGE